MATKRQILAALRSAAFAPNKPGPLRVIAEAGNTEYFLRRAKEFLTLALTALTPHQRAHYLTMALSITALAKVENGTPQDQTQARPRV